MWGFFGKNLYFGFSEAVCIFGDIFTCKSNKYGSRLVDCQVKKVNMPQEM